VRTRRRSTTVGGLQTLQGRLHGGVADWYANHTGFPTIVEEVQAEHSNAAVVWLAASMEVSTTLCCKG